MGLDFTHCEAHWSYSGFMVFRRKLAKAIGVDLNRMEGFVGMFADYAWPCETCGCMRASHLNRGTVCSKERPELEGPSDCNGGSDAPAGGRCSKGCLKFVPVLPRSWDDIENPKDPLVAFLWHSDCDGDLDARTCAKLAPRLIEAISSWPDDDYDKVQGLLLAGGMLKAAKRGQKLGFH